MLYAVVSRAKNCALEFSAVRNLKKNSKRLHFWFTL